MRARVEEPSLGMEGSAAGAAPPGTRGEGGTPSVTPVIDVSDGYWTPKAKAKQ